MDAPPTELAMRPARLSELAADAGLRVMGEDREILTLAPTESATAQRSAALTWATSEAYLERALDRGFAAAVVSASLGDAADGDMPLIMVPDGHDVGDAFFAILAATVRDGRWEGLPSRIDPAAEIAPTARVHPGVVVESSARVMDHAVLLPNTWVGEGAVIKPNATLGGDGLQIARVDGRPVVVPHAGGVVIEAGATIGSQTCVDRGLFGDMTRVGVDTHVDNLVHVAHSVQIGDRAVVVACAEISGSVTIGDGAWLGPRCAINPSIRVGNHAFIGTGSTVVRDVPDHALAFGAPARVRGWRCACRATLDVTGATGRCGACGRTIELEVGDA